MRGTLLDVRRHVVDGTRVVKRRHPWSASTHEFLCFPEVVTTRVTPRALGLTRRFEVLEYIPGTTTPDLGRAGEFVTENFLLNAGEALRRVHDAGSKFLATSSPGIWFPHSIDLGRAETICHNDLMLSNIVLRASGRVSLIDWEMAAPGVRSSDLAMMAWHAVPLYCREDRQTAGDYSDFDAWKRLCLLWEGYGVGEYAKSREAQLMFFSTLARVQEWAASLTELARAKETNYLTNWASIPLETFSEDIRALASARRLLQSGVAIQKALDVCIN